MPKIKPNTQKRKMTITHRPVLIIIVILVIAIIGLILAKILTNNTTDGKNQSDDAAPEATTQTEAPDTSIGANNTDADYDNPQTPKQYEGENANTYTNLTGAITYAEVSGDALLIRTNIDQYISGTCNLTMTNNGKTVTKTSSIEQNPTTSSCTGFDIPVSELSSGTWQINIKVTSKNNKTGTLTGEATI